MNAWMLTGRGVTLPVSRVDCNLSLSAIVRDERLVGSLFLSATYIFMPDYRRVDFNKVCASAKKNTKGCLLASEAFKQISFSFSKYKFIPNYNSLVSCMQHQGGCSNCLSAFSILLQLTSDFWSWGHLSHQ